jgi:zinc protease
MILRTTMGNKLKTLVGLWVGLCLMSGFSHAQYADSIEIPFTRFTLDNGLTLLVHEDNKAPIVAINIWYHVGSKNERPGITGFAHLFEHLMFNGSENYDGEWFLPLELAGGTDLNGTTWFDRTNYFQTVPTPAMDRVLWMESDRMGHLLGAITQEKLDEQRSVVQNEKRQGDNRAYGGSEYLQLAAMFPEGHPYRWSTIGSMDDLNAASLDDVKEWFETYYGASNAVLVVAGDVDPEHVFERVNHYFGDIEAGPPLSRPQVWIAKRNESTRDIMVDDVPQARLTKAWNTPEFGSDESIYLEVAGQILGGGKNSRLYNRLVYEDQIATSVSASQGSFEIAGMFEIEAYAKEGVDLETIEAAINEELQRFLDDGPTRDELERVKASYFSGFIRGLEKVGGFSGKSQLLATFEVYTGDAGYYKEDLRLWESATSRQVRDTARAWLSNGDYNLEVHPQPQYQVAEAGADRSQLPSAGEAPALVFPEIESFELANGIPVLLVQRGDLPLVSMTTIFDAGYSADKGNILGTASFTTAMLDEGTDEYDALELADLEERLGASIGAGSSLDTTQVSLTALVPNLRESIELYAEIVRNPTFPEADLERVRIAALAGIAREKADPQQLALRNLPPLLYPEGHPYGIPLTGSGTEESISSIQRGHLLEFYNQWIRPDNATMVVVGSMSREEIQPELERAFGDWQVTAVAMPSKDLPLEGRTADAGVIYLLDKPGAPQSMIIGGQLMPASNWGQSEILEMATRALGGTFNSRLNMNLREDKGWAYGARAFLPDSRAQRPLIYYAPVQSDKTLDSMLEIFREVDEYISTNPITQEELDRNREGMLRSLPGRLETASAVRGYLLDLVTYNRPLDYFETSQELLRNMEIPEIAAIAAEQIRPQDSIWLIVGDLSEIEQPLRDSGIAEIRILEE